MECISSFLFFVAAARRERRALVPRNVLKLLTGFHVLEILILFLTFCDPLLWNDGREILRDFFCRFFV